MIVVDTFETPANGGAHCTSWVTVAFTGVMRMLSPSTAISMRRRIGSAVRRLKLLVETRAAGSAT